MTADDVLHRRRDTAIRHVLDPDAGSFVEKLAHQVEHRSDTGATIRQLIRVRLGVGDELRNRIHRQRRGHREAGHRFHRGDDRREVLDRIIGQILHQMHGCDVRPGCRGEQRVAVRR